jgi:hypothetical protein
MRRKNEKVEHGSTKLIGVCEDVILNSNISTVNNNQIPLISEDHGLRSDNHTMQVAFMFSGKHGNIVATRQHFLCHVSHIILRTSWIWSVPMHHKEDTARTMIDLRGKV